jgi:hypothetical protein
VIYAGPNSNQGLGLGVRATARAGAGKCGYGPQCRCSCRFSAVVADDRRVRNDGRLSSRNFYGGKGAPPRGTGRVLESADGEARLMVYVEENDARQSPASFVRSNLTRPIAQID